MLEVRTFSQVCLGLKIDVCKLKLRWQISLTCQTVSFGHLDFSLVQAAMFLKFHESSTFFKNNAYVK